ncbi:MAG TPA: winged helix-turn-helix domain-containing protein [Acidimicrobiia bacterium]|nr:winged helix-turn-helix domain-containing protein [Acidimicrobiia bacterium]
MVSARRRIEAVLLDKRELAGIEAGTITIVFRRWRTPRIRVGTRVRTPIGLVEITGLTRTVPDAVTETESHAAGFADFDEFCGWLGDRPGDLYRIELRWAGVDPRVALRQGSHLDEAEVAEVQRRLGRMDSRADSPWTWQTLRLIQANPGVVSTDLAARMGLERAYFKQRVRRLKELGLTESLEVGYRISPRGQALLDATDPA